MPQFDKITFFNQLFWLLFFFSSFYLILLYYFLPRLSKVLKARQKMSKLFLSGISTMFNECLEVKTSSQHACSILLSHKNANVFLISALEFIELVKINLFSVFNSSLKSGVILAENRLYRQTSIFFFLSDLQISNDFFLTIE